MSRLHRLGQSVGFRDHRYYSVIGEALGSIALAMPTAFLETKSRIPGMPRLGLVLEELEADDERLNSDQEIEQQESDLSVAIHGTHDIPPSLAVGVPLLCK